MRVTAVEVFPISLPLSKPLQMSHVTIDTSHNVLVKITSDDGNIGWGEGVSALDVTGENQGRIAAAIDDFGSRIIGSDPRRRTAIWSRFRSRVHGNATAIGAIDIALHDLVGRALGVPVADLLGGMSRHSVPALTLLGSGDTPADMTTFAERYDAGFRWFKLKLGIGDRADEVETLRRMTNAAADVVICGDANGAWTESESARFLAKLVDLDVRFVEQPTLRTDAMIRLAASSPVPLCVDESTRTLDDLMTFANTSVAGVSLKLIKHCGITGVMRAATLCDSLGLAKNLAGKIAESSIAAAANVHCAAAMPDTPFGCSPGNQTIAEDITRDSLLPIDGAFTVPAGPGLGIAVDEAKVESLLT